MSDVAEVDRFTTLPQQQQPVEDLEKFGRRLMNPGLTFNSRLQTVKPSSDARAENSLSVVG